MKHIVPWQVAMVFVTIGTYAIILTNDGSERTAVVAAAVAAFAFAFTFAATFAVVVAAVAVFAAFAVAFAAAAAAFAASVASVAVAVFAASVAVFAVTAAADEFGVPKRWALTAYGIEVGAIFGALVTGSVGWALAIGAMGILALLAVWKFGPRAALNARPAGVAPTPAPNGG